MACFQFLQRICIDLGDGTRIDHGDVLTGFSLHLLSDSFAEGKEGTERQDRHFFAFAECFVGWRFEVDQCIFSGDNRSVRQADGDRSFFLLQSPFQHRNQFLLAGRRKIVEIRDALDQRNVEQAVMRHCTARDVPADDDEYGRQFVDGQIMR